MDTEFKENLLTILEHVTLLHFRTLSDFMFCCGLGSLTVFDTNAILTQFPLSEQNIFSNCVCKLQVTT